MVEAIALIKYIAANSAYSRRKAGDIIKDKRVTVNGKVVRKPWHEVTEEDDIRIDGEEILPSKKVYVMLNKPEGVITSMADEEGRLDVSTLIKGASKERLYPIGRLDKDTGGLLLFTNDGQLAQKLAHPKFEVHKQYMVTLDRPVLPEHLAMMYKGIYLLDGKVRADKAVYVPKKHKFVVLVELHSGKKRVIRRLFGKLGYIVKKLERVGYAGLIKKGLLPGKWRHLRPFEVNKLKKL
jgi:23S rRNA pseudouridine2605 synthase